MNTKKLIAKRRLVQAAAGAGLYLAATYFQISLIYIILGGAVLGILLGKVFCRWICPIGFFMEIMMGGNKKGSEASQMYQYHKMGCPIAWAGGFLNKFSLFGIRKDSASCTSCGICDKNCYISSLNDSYSLYKEEKQSSGDSFSCSRCLECVASCPNNSLSFSFLPKRKSSN